MNKMDEAYFLPNFRLVKMSLLRNNRCYFAKIPSEALAGDIR